MISFRSARAFGFSRVLGLALAAGTVALAAGTLDACEPYQNTRTARGQLASVGMNPYDDYFKKVHAEQVVGAAWGEERREARKGLIASLGLLPDATNDTILAAIRARIKAQSVAAVAPEVDAVAKAELSRADRVEAKAPTFEELANQGEDLKPNVAKDFPKDFSKRRDAENELGASAYTLRQLAIEARSHAREARRFAAELGETVGAQYLPKSAASAEPAPSASASASASAAPATKKPPHPKPPSDPKPPAPKPTGGGETFTP